MPLAKINLTQLIEQKQQLVRNEHAYKNQQEWLQRRKSVEGAILQLQEEIEQALHQLHFQKSQAAVDWQILIQEKRSQLDQLKQVQRELDHSLDQTEELTADGLDAQREALFLAIWQVYPAYQAKQQAAWEEWKAYSAIQRELETLDPLLCRFLEALHLIAQTCQSVKKKGILKYLFGISPYGAIQQRVLNMYQLISPVQAVLEKLMEHRPFMTLAQDLAALMDSLHFFCQSSWSLDDVEGVVDEAYQTLFNLLKVFKQQQENLMKRKYQLEAEIERWIQQLEA